MSKIDLKNTFRLITVRPNDWNLLGICWRKQFYAYHLALDWPLTSLISCLPSICYFIHA